MLTSPFSSCSEKAPQSSIKSKNALIFLEPPQKKRILKYNNWNKLVLTAILLIETNCFSLLRTPFSTIHRKSCYVYFYCIQILIIIGAFKIRIPVMGISDMVKDMGLIKLEECGAFMYLKICHLECINILTSCGVICEVISSDLKQEIQFFTAIFYLYKMRTTFQ